MLALNAERVAGFTSVRLFLDSIELALGVALRRGHSDSSIKMRSYRQGFTPLSLRKVIEFINDNLQCDLSLQQIADTAGLSVSHFSRMLRISTGSSPHQYLLKQRVHHGRELIRRSGIRVLDVASECGFKSQQHFARVFRNEFGVNPTECRSL